LTSTYWFLAKTACELIVPSPTTAASRARSQKTRNSRDWLATLRAELDGDAGNAYFGILSRTRRNKGIARPPAPMNSRLLDVSFLDREATTPLGVDLRAQVGRADAWNLAVRAARPNSRVTLTWPDLGGAPKQLRFYLVDEATGARRYMRTTTGYSFQTGSMSEERRLRIEVASDITVSRLTAKPNVHSSNRVSGFNFSLTLSKAATVRARILSPSGRAVAVVAQERAAREGQNFLPWNGKSASGAALSRGVYLLEVTATTEEG